MPAVSVERRQEGDQHLAVVQPRDLLGARRRDLRDDVGRPRIADRRARLAVGLVGESGGVPCARLDDHVHTVSEPSDGLGDQCDATSRREPAPSGLRVASDGDVIGSGSNYRRVVGTDSTRA